VSNDPRARRRATAAVIAHHRPRQLQREPRLSRADERTVIDRVRRQERVDAQADVRQRIAIIRRELDAIAVKIGAAAAGNHRDQIRMIRRGLDSLERSVSG
jgi:hypothetical protein